MKEYNLGDKVFVYKYLKSKKSTPLIPDTSYSRYDLTEINKKGIFCGKRNIFLEGAIKEYCDAYEGNVREFIAKKILCVNLIAISKKQLIYVPDEWMVKSY